MTTHDTAQQSRLRPAEPQTAPRQADGNSAHAASAPTASPATLTLQRYREQANNSPQALQLQLRARTMAAAPAFSPAGPAPLQRQPTPNRTGLPDRLKSGMESLSGLNMDHVKVHYNSDKPAQLQAHAYAHGSEIHVGPGQERHLPHEAWHVVQQAQGRVRPTLQMKGRLALNDDVGLEREADAMGAKMSAFDPTLRAPARLVRPGPAQSAAQLAAPGSIQHVTNSCFVAAMINIFTVTPSLKNLLNPDSRGGDVPQLGAGLETLRNLLFRAVNTVDATAAVPALWVKTIMTALANNGFIDHAEATEDVNVVLTRVVQALQHADAAVGQQNGNLGGGACTWQDGDSIVAATTAGFPNLIPNAIFFNRVADPAGIEVPVAAPPTFQVQVGDQHRTYRLTAIIQRNAADYVDQRGNKAAHFVSYVDRGDEDSEWWQSDDIGPRVVAVQAIAAVPVHGGAGVVGSSAASSGSDGSPSDAIENALAAKNLAINKDMLMSRLSTRRQGVRPDDADEGAGDDAGTEPASASMEDGLATSSARRVAPLGPLHAGFDATRNALTYVYQIASEADLATHDDFLVGNNADTQAIVDAQTLLYAERQIGNLDLPEKQQQARRALRGMLFFPAVQERIASDNTLFAKLYVSIKEPRIDPRHRFDGDAKTDDAKRRQRIHSISDQLHYLLSRLGSGPTGLANMPGFKQNTGTELLSEMNQTTAKEAQASTLAKLVAHYLGDEVRLPVYRHRAGPMLGRTTQYQANGMTMEEYNQAAAATYQQILSSPDEIGSNIRVTDATAGPGAYISTDGDNFYGPHGFAFDPRDVHQLPLSKKSTDNHKQHSAERTKERQQQFRATAEPIPFVENGASRIAEYFVGSSEAQRADLPTTLVPSSFNPGILPITAEALLRRRFRQQLGLAPLVTSHASPLHDQPKDAEQVALVGELLQELEGLYEPLEWAQLWQQADAGNPLSSLMRAFERNYGAAKATVATDAGNDNASDDSTDDEWD